MSYMLFCVNQRIKDTTEYQLGVVIILPGSSDSEELGTVQEFEGVGS